MFLEDYKKELGENMSITEQDLDFTAFSFDEIKESLRNIIQKDGIISDSSFEGSNTNAVLNVLAYTEALLNNNINFMANEQFLQTASLRKNILKHAKTLRYRVQRKISSKADTIISFTLEDGQTIHIPQFQQISVQEGDGTTFLLLDPITVTNDTGASKTYSFNQSIKEGNLITNKEEPSLEFSYNNEEMFTIGVKNIENEGIFVSATKQNNTVVNFEEYIQGKSYNHGNVFIADFDPDTEYVQLTKDVSLEYDMDLFFGYLINIKVIQSNGFDGNGYSKFNAFSIDGVDVSVEIDPLATYQKSYGGFDEESVSSIKKYAPLYHSAGDRAITKNDWISVLSNHGLIESGYAWGGEEFAEEINISSQPDFPNAEIYMMKKLGDVYLSGIHSGSDTNTPTYFNENEISTILNDASNYCVMGVRRNFVQPSFYHIDTFIEAFIENSPKYNTSELQTEIQKVVSSYFDEQDTSFLRSFKYSKMINDLYNIEGILSVDIKWPETCPENTTGETIYSKFILEFTKNMFHTFESYKDSVIINLPLQINNEPLDKFSGEYGNLEISYPEDGNIYSDDYDFFLVDFDPDFDAEDIPSYYNFFTLGDPCPYDASTHPDPQNPDESYKAEWKSFLKKIFYKFPSDHPTHAGQFLYCGEFNGRWNQIIFYNNMSRALDERDSRIHTFDGTHYISTSEIFNVYNIFESDNDSKFIQLKNKNGSYFDLSHIKAVKENIMIPGNINISATKITD